MSRTPQAGSRQNLDMIMLENDSSPVISRPSTSRRSKNECITQIEPVVLTQRWTVNNFASLVKLSQPGMCLRSNVFRDPAAPDSCWQLCLYPGGKRNENANNVSLFLKMSATSSNKEVLVKAEYRFHFLDDDDNVKFNNINVGDFHAKPPKGGHSWGLRNIPRAKVLNAIRSDNSLVIACTIELIPDVSRVPCRKVTSHDVREVQSLPVPLLHIERELAMLDSGLFSDFVICVNSSGGEDYCEFPVHSAKLAAQSEVFRAMLTIDMEEAKNGRIMITDFSSGAIRAMLEFIYSGTIMTELTFEESAGVMQLAEKYDIVSLKSICEQQLVDRIGPGLQMLGDYLELADTYRAEELFNHCMDMAIANKAKLMGTENWQLLKERNPRLASQVLERMLIADQMNISPPLKKSRI